MNDQRQQDPRVRAAWAIPGMDWEPELDWMARAFAGSKRHVEIGSFGGKSLWASTAGMTDATVWAVDDLLPRPGQPHNVPSQDWLRGVLQQTIAAIRECNSTLVVDHLELDSKAAADQISGLIDSAYIDGDHRLPAVSRDLAIWRRKIRPGGILAGHDFWPERWPGVCQAVRAAFGPSGFHRPPGTRIWWVRIPG